MVKEEAGRLGIALEILRKRTDFLRRIMAPVGGRGRGTLSVHLPALQQFFFGGPVLVGFDDEEALQMRYEWRPNSTNEDEAKAFRAYAVPQGHCENLNNTLKLLANQ